MHILIVLGKVTHWNAHPHGEEVALKGLPTSTRHGIGLKKGISILKIGCDLDSLGR